MTREATKRPPGRPRGTDYTAMDAHIHNAMRLLIASGQAPCLSQAAKQLVHLAYGWGTDDSKVRRLVRTYPY